jgi:hypothetical protein
VAHTYNLSYSGGKDQENCSSKPAQANNLRDATSKTSIAKVRLVEWLKVWALSSNSSTSKIKIDESEEIDRCESKVHLQ